MEAEKENLVEFIDYAQEDEKGKTILKSGKTWRSTERYGDGDNILTHAGRDRLKERNSSALDGEGKEVHVRTTRHDWDPELEGWENRAPTTWETKYTVKAENGKWETKPYNKTSSEEEAQLDHKEILKYLDGGYRAEEIPPHGYEIKAVKESFETLRPYIFVKSKESGEVILAGSYNSYLKSEQGTIMECFEKKNGKWEEVVLTDKNPFIEPMHKVGNEALKELQEKNEEKYIQNLKEGKDELSENPFDRPKVFRYATKEEVESLLSIMPEMNKNKISLPQKDISKSQQKKPSVTVVKHKRASKGMER